MPFIVPVDDRQFQVEETVADESLGRVRIRFRLSGKYLLTTPLSNKCPRIQNNHFKCLKLEFLDTDYFSDAPLVSVSTL